jgi:hypothetical protein
MKQEYTGALTSQLRKLTRPDMGLQFNAQMITAEKMKSCTIKKIADDIKTHAPDLWNLVGRLLDADPIIHDHRKKDREKRERDRKSRRPKVGPKNRHFG